MRKFKNANEFKYEGIKPHQILVVCTSYPDYEMQREMLLCDIEGLKYGEYLYLDGWHCSCYDFDETDWDGIIYTKEELIELSRDRKDDKFWSQVYEQLN